MSPRSQNVEQTNATLAYGLFNTPQLTECKTYDKMHKMRILKIFADLLILLFLRIHDHYV